MKKKKVVKKKPKMKASDLKKDSRLNLRINKYIKEYLTKEKGISLQEVLDNFINKEIGAIDLAKLLNSEKNKKE